MLATRSPWCRESGRRRWRRRWRWRAFVCGRTFGIGTWLVVGEPGRGCRGGIVKAVHGVWWAGEDGFVGKESLNVGGECRRGFVATGSILLQCFHHNP